MEGFTQREVERENACRKLMHDLSARSYENLKKILLVNLIRDFPVSFGDANLAIKICGTNVPVLKGVNVRPWPPVVERQDIIELPEELLIEETELTIDVIYVEGEALLHVMDTKIKSKSAVLLCMTKKQQSKTSHMQS